MVSSRVTEDGGVRVELNQILTHLCGRDTTSVLKLQSCLGVGVENSRPKVMVRVENFGENVG